MNSKIVSMALGVTVACAACPSRLMADDVEGFTEPYRTVDVAATEVGIVTQMQVREGDEVRKGQTLATLDQDVHLALLAITEASKDAAGRLDSAQAELELKRQRLAQLEQLSLKGHARQEEVQRARADVAIAEANVRAVHEDMLIRKLEYDKMAVQLQRRTINSPLAAVVAIVHKEVGEAVSPNDPQLVTLVQLDSLLATFSVSTADAARLRPGAVVKLRFAGSDSPAEGSVEFVSPTIDAESGTVRVKVRIDNSAAAHRSGQRCTLEIPGK